MKKKDFTIDINNVENNKTEKVNISLYYKIICQKVVSKYFYLNKRCLKAYGMEEEDLKQEILLMIWTILIKNSKTNKISSDNIGGYLFNATKWRLNSILSKAITAYKHTINNSNYPLENVPDIKEINIKKSEKILKLFRNQNNKDLKNIINEICTTKEANATQEYYFNKLNTVQIGKKMNLTNQRISALINSALFKLNHYFTQFLTESEKNDD